MKPTTHPYCMHSVERTGTCTKRATRAARTINPDKPIYLCDDHAAPLIDCTDPYEFRPPEPDYPDDFHQWPDEMDDLLV